MGDECPVTTTIEKEPQLRLLLHIRIHYASNPSASMRMA